MSYINIISQSNENTVVTEYTPEPRSADTYQSEAELEKKFISEAEQNGFVNLKGHRTVGGMRASIYNAMPIEGVEKLVEFMAKFEEENK